MSKYIENPKSKGSGIFSAIPQKGKCPIGCADCFFQGGRSYLEPLDENLPNIPDAREMQTRVVRVNDGNDSNVDKDQVISNTNKFPMRFFNTSIPDLDFPDPVVLTLNPGQQTDTSIHEVEKPFPVNLMYVRFRANMWNIDLLRKAVEYYKEIPIVLTFMRYYKEEIPEEFQSYYTFKKKIINEYWQLNDEAWDFFRVNFLNNENTPNVFSCGSETEYLCNKCGICLREYFATKERMREHSAKA